MSSTPDEKVILEKRKTFLQQLKILVKSEYEEIFRIIKHYDVPYTENSNGIFFDVNTIPIEPFQKMCEFLEFCIIQRKHEEERKKEIEGLLRNS